MRSWSAVLLATLPGCAPLRSLTASVLFVALLGAASAHAQDADALIEQGLDLREQGDDRRALRLFEDAYELEPSMRAIAQIALAEQALGRWVEAHTHLAEALASEDAWVAARRAPLERALETIRSHVGWIDVTGAVAGAVVRLDGRNVGALPLDGPVLVTAGTVGLEVTAEGFFPMRRNVEVGAGAHAREQARLQPLPEGVTSADGLTSPAPPDTTAIQVAGWATLGAGIGAAIVAAALMGVREDRAAFLASEACDPPNAATSVGDIPECRDAHGTAVATETTAVGLFIGGGTLAITGAVLLILAASGDDDPSTACAPWLDGAGAGAGCRGTF